MRDKPACSSADRPAHAKRSSSSSFTSTLLTSAAQWSEVRPSLSAAFLSAPDFRGKEIQVVNFLAMKFTELVLIKIMLCINFIARKFEI